MKARKSFVRRNIIAISFLIIVALISFIKIISKEVLYYDLIETEKSYLEQIKNLEDTLEDEKKNLESIDTLEFIEKYARETLKMVKPDEIYFLINYSKNDDN